MDGSSRNGPEFFGERPLGTQKSPERPFPLCQGPAAASVDAKPDPAVFRVICKFAVPTGPGAKKRECKAGLSFRASGSESRNRDHQHRGLSTGRSLDSSTPPLRGSARNDSPAVLPFIRPIVVPTGAGAMEPRR